MTVNGARGLWYKVKFNQAIVVVTSIVQKPSENCLLWTKCPVLKYANRVAKVHEMERYNNRELNRDILRGRGAATVHGGSGGSGAIA